MTPEGSDVGNERHSIRVMNPLLLLLVTDGIQAGTLCPYRRACSGRRHAARVLAPGTQSLRTIQTVEKGLERVYGQAVRKVIGRKAFDQWAEEREGFSRGAWNVEAWTACQQATCSAAPEPPG